MMLLFQHNAVLAQEYTSIRRALKIALRQVDEAQNTNLADTIKLTVIRTGLFDMALRLVKFWDPVVAEQKKNGQLEFTHSLSREAYDASSNRKKKHGLEKLLVGPVVILTIPSSSPAHLRAALSILFPGPGFPAPRKRINAAYYDPAVQNGVPKLLLLGARVEAKMFDISKITWIGSLQGGLPGLRAQLVQMLQSVPAGLTGALESASRGLYGILEGRRLALEEEENDGQRTDTKES
jgi:large subunit ribosomal protein L10